MYERWESGAFFTQTKPPTGKLIAIILLLLLFISTKVKIVLVFNINIKDHQGMIGEVLIHRL